MRKPMAAFIFSTTMLALGASFAAAGPRGIPHRYAPGSLDGRLSQVTAPAGGATISVWAYRSGAEYDIAISRAEADGSWSEPVFIGAFDGADQVQPVLAFDAAGNAYLAYADLAAGRIMITMSPAGTRAWAAPRALTAPQSDALSPALKVVGDRLVVAWRVGRDVQLLDLPLYDPTRTIRTITDSPDPVEYRPGPGSGDEPPFEGWLPGGKWIIGGDDDEKPVEFLYPDRSSGPTVNRPPE